MRVVLATGYEMGHQPIHLGSPAAALLDAGHEVKCFDTSVHPLDDFAVDWADALAISVPMHTAMRLGIELAKTVRSRRSNLPICMYGLYATLGADQLLGSVADQLIAGEYEPSLVSWVDGLGESPMSSEIEPVVVDLNRRGTTVPARELLPPLPTYARLEAGGEQMLVGYVEASHGCRHRCRHCPVPVVYDGRIRVVDPAVVVADVVELVAAGAEHITFGDPDFFNAIPHSMRIIEAVHAMFPDLTFDCTIKVDHLLGHHEDVARLARNGCLFVVSALESTSDRILDKLRKGHNSTDSVKAIELLRAHGIEMRPSFLPFTPWTTMGDIADLFDFIVSHELVGNVDPVQLTIRLLIPEGSLLLDDPELRSSLGAYDSERLSYEWSSSDEIEQLQTSLASALEKFTVEAAQNHEIFASMWSIVGEASDRVLAVPDFSHESALGRPRLTEPWFC